MFLLETLEALEGVVEQVEDIVYTAPTAYTNHAIQQATTYIAHTLTHNLQQPLTSIHQTLNDAVHRATLPLIANTPAAPPNLALTSPPASPLSSRLASPPLTLLSPTGSRANSPAYVPFVPNCGLLGAKRIASHRNRRLTWP